MEYTNRRCRCALITGPIVERRGRCGSIGCGGKGEVRGDVVLVEEEERRDVVEEDGKEEKVGIQDCCM